MHCAVRQLDIRLALGKWVAGSIAHKLEPIVCSAEGG